MSRADKGVDGAVKAPHVGGPSGRALLGRGQQVGVVVAAAVAPRTFAASLSTRSWVDQGLITGLSTGTHYVLTLAAQDVLDLAARGLTGSFLMPSGWSPERRATAATVLCEGLAAPVGFGLVALVDRAGPLTGTRAVVRQGAWRLALTGLAGSVLGGSLALTRWADDALGANGRLAAFPIAVPVGLATSLVAERLRQDAAPSTEPTDPAATNPLLGLAAAAGVVLLVAGVGAGEEWAAGVLSTAGRRVIPASELTWRVVGHAAAISAIVATTQAFWRVGMRRIEDSTTAYDDALASPGGVWTSPRVSGDPQSLVSWASLGREGRRHVTTYVRPKPPPSPVAFHDGAVAPDLSIRTVMGQDAVADPVAIFVGLDSAPTATQRVELALAEMDRTDAWSRSLLMLVSPTGTGYVNYVATATAQYLTLGDVATVTMQYSKRPSPLSLAKVKIAREQNRLLWLHILERLRQVPASQRPKVVLFGESLGAHTSQDVLLGWGTLGPQALGIDRALWIGTPDGSKWRHEIADRSRPDVDGDLVAIVNDYEQLCERSPAERATLRYVLVSHDNDGVTKFGLDLLSRCPPWLGPQRPEVREIPGRSPRGTPQSMRWRPVTTFFQTLVDMKNAQLPGSYRAWGHDYRPDLPDFIRDVFALDCTSEQLDRIKAAVQEREEFRESIFR